MPSALYQAESDIVSSGVKPGLANSAVPLWVRSNNFVFRDGGAKIGPNQTLLFTKESAEVGLGALAVDNDGSAALLWGDKTNLWKGLSAPATVQISKAPDAYTGTVNDLWSIVQFGQTALATNGIDAVQYLASLTAGLYVDIDTVSDLAGTFRCQILNKLGPYIIAFNTDNDNTEARWCTEDNPLVWTPIASNSARDINLRDLNSDIVTTIEFGGSLLIVGRTRIHIFQFLGPPFFFGAKKFLDGVGVAGKHAIVVVGRRIYGMSPTGIFVTDGSDYQFIDDPDVHKFIYEETLDIDEISRSVLWYNANEDAVMVSYPTKDGNGFTLGFNIKLRSWSMHEFWRTAATSGDLWDSPILLDPTGNVWLQGGDAGSAANFQSKPLALSSAFEVKTGMGVGSMGQGPYGGLLADADIPPTGDALAVIGMFFTPLGGTKKNLGSSLETSQAFIETKAIALKEDQFVYFIDRITSHITDREDQKGLTIEVYGSDNEDGPFDLLVILPLAKNDPGYVDIAGKRWYKFIWNDSAVTSRYVFHGFDVYGEPGGDEF